MLKCFDPFDDTDAVEAAAGEVLDLLRAKGAVIYFYIIDHGVKVLAIFTGADQYRPVSGVGIT